MRINTNTAAYNAARNLGMTQGMVNDSMSKLSSGFRIARAADDAAGLGIANKLRADVGALTQAAQNAEQGNSLLQIAEGATNGIFKMLERLKVLATQGASDTVDTAGRQRIHEEYTQLSAEITRTVQTTKFQGSTLLDGTFANYVEKTNASGVYANTTALNVTALRDVRINGTVGSSLGTDYTISQSQVASAGRFRMMTITNGNQSQTIDLVNDGAQTVRFDAFGLTLELGSAFNATAAQFTGPTNNLIDIRGTGNGQFLVGASGNVAQDTITVSNLNLSVSQLNINGLDFTTLAGAAAAITNIDAAIGTVNQALGQIGAVQNRIESAAANLKTSIQNYSAAQSVIRDLDMAEEMTRFTKNNILVQAGTAMLAQANQSSQSVLQLLRG